MAVGVNSGEHGYLPTKEDNTPPVLASMAPLPPEVARTDDPPAFPETLKQLEKELNERIAIDTMLAGIAVIRRGNELVLRMDATALFDSGEDRVRPEAQPLLLAVADEVREKSVAIRVEGHTDDQPIKTLRFRSNWDLSTARATSVVAVLASDGKIDPRRLMAAGYAEFQPLAPNDTNEGRAKNRRVDFVLSVSLGKAQWTGKEADFADKELAPMAWSEGPAPAPAEAAPAPAPAEGAGEAEHGGGHDEGGHGGH